jgi:murein DD-endopeptidase MepM/ murein hydrolase activator NlpD
MRRRGYGHRGRGGVLLAFALAGTVAACARDLPAPVVFRDQQPIRAPLPAQRPPQPHQAVHHAAPGRHLVAAGETVYAVAQRYGLSAQTVIDANRLSPPFNVVPGQMLVLPVAQTHQVVRGDTLYGIGRAYNVDIASLVRVNDLSPPYLLYVGQALRLPTPGDVEIQVADATVAASDEQVPYPRLKPTTAQAQTVAAAGPPPDPPKRAAATFLWPVRGRIVSGYGAKPGGLHNDGVNIAARRGEPVRAAENGVVVYVGNELKGFGNLVLVRHEGGWVSAYAHADELLVQKGALVRRGQVIARVGSSGAVNAPQLHFELRRGARTVDPLRYLDTQQVALSEKPPNG